MSQKKLAVPKKVRVLFALSQLSDKLRSDVLKDPATGKQWKISTTRTVHLGKGLTVQWKSLYSIFRAAADGTPIPSLHDEKNKKHAVKATIDMYGAGILQVGKHRLRFPQAVLMATSPDMRLRELERNFGSVTIHASLQDELRRIVRRSDFWVEEFIAIARALSSSPDEFQMRLSEKVSTRQIALGDVLPDDHRHWDNLTAPVASSGTLADFIANELASEWASRVARDPVFAFRSIALTFCAPALVPYDLFRKLDKEAKKLILEEALLLEDHFSLVGAFELCAEWILEYPEFSDAGERLLDRLFGDLKRLETACGMFAAAFILSVAKIAEDDMLNPRPAFWRHLAAASHALLVVRSCGVTEIDCESLIEWAMGQSGHAYFLSVFCDFKTDPQWRPEWIDPRFLVADACGRGIGAYLRISENKAPPSWTERINKLRTWINEKHYGVLMHFPAVLEGARRSTLPTVSEMQGVGELYEAFMREPTIDSLIELTPVIQSFGPPHEIIDSFYKVIGIIRADSSRDEEGLVANVIKLLSHVAALLQDTKLANAVAEACIERLAVDERPETVIEAIYRLLECSAAETDKIASSQFLSRMLEHVCYTITKPELLPGIAAMIEELKLVSPELKCALGRALAIARLGASRSVAA